MPEGISLDTKQFQVIEYNFNAKRPTNLSRHVKWLNEKTSNCTEGVRRIHFNAFKSLDYHC